MKRQPLTHSTVQTIIDTIRTLATMELTRDELYDLAVEIEKDDPLKRVCCVMCEEMDCDKVCPFSKIRAPGGNR